MLSDSHDQIEARVLCELYVSLAAMEGLRLLLGMLGGVLKEHRPVSDH
jgi:hypothetical protein